MSDWKNKMQRWLSYDGLDADLRAELHALAADISHGAEAAEECFYKDLEFGTGGLRGTIGVGCNRLNIYTIRRATQGLADYIKGELRPSGAAVAVGYDSRNKSRLFAEETVGVLVANGIRAYMYDTLYPVPGLVFALRHYECDMGVMITASHNPAAYNGYKVYNGFGYQVTNDEAAKILEYMEKVDIFDDARHIAFAEAKKSPLFVSMGEETKALYIDMVLREACCRPEDRAAMESLKVVYTPLNGAGNEPVREVMGRLGIQNVSIVKEQEYPDGDFPTCPYPNPEKDEALKAAIDLFERESAELLIATDPDCDRMRIAARTRDGKCRLFSGNETGLLLFDHIVTNRARTGAMPPNPVAARTIVSGRLIDKIAEANGIAVKVTLTGFKYIGEFIRELADRGREDSYIFGFEESCGYLSGTYVRDKDGVNAALLACCMAASIKAKGSTPDVELEKIYERYGFVKNELMDFTFAGMDGMKKIQAAMSSFRNERPTCVAGRSVERVIDYLTDETGLPKSDVIAYELEGGSGFSVRPSGTEPKLKIYMYAAGTSQEEADRLCEDLKRELDLQEKK